MKADNDVISRVVVLMGGNPTTYTKPPTEDTVDAALTQLEHYVKMAQLNILTLMNEVKLRDRTGCSQCGETQIHRTNYTGDTAYVRDALYYAGMSKQDLEGANGAYAVIEPLKTRHATRLIAWLNEIVETAGKKWGGASKIELPENVVKVDFERRLGDGGC